MNKDLVEKCLLPDEKRSKYIELPVEGYTTNREELCRAQLEYAIPIITEEYETKGYVKGCDVTTKMFSKAKDQALKAQAEEIRKGLEKNLIYIALDNDGESHLCLRHSAIESAKRWQNFFERYGVKRG